MTYSNEVTRKILKHVRCLEISTDRLLNDQLIGTYKSIFKGQGIDFEEVREYAPGDDVRAIDWNVTAKMDRPFIKKFKEERELTMMILVDMSGSMDFGSSRSKREIATELASLFAFSANKNNDKVGLILFTNIVEKLIKPDKGRKHSLRIIRDILFHKPTGNGTDFVGTLGYVNNILKRRSIIFIISDFATDELDQKSDDMIRALKLTDRHHDLVCIKISDPRETFIPNIGILTLEDMETGEVLEIDTSNKTYLKKYISRMKEKESYFCEKLNKAKIDVLSISTDEHYIKSLENFLHARKKRRN
ncbi:MAG: DUF58 domain-containing protein [Puniceicoccales bacterium]|jgi:uncharacterized protein (DUF58 family)|nr:DUF58 domain-containing protein [Puniceicoccales bacterium]